MFQLGMVLEAESTHYAVAPCYGKEQAPLVGGKRSGELAVGLGFRVEGAAFFSGAAGLGAGVAADCLLSLSAAALLRASAALRASASLRAAASRSAFLRRRSASARACSSAMRRSSSRSRASARRCFSASTALRLDPSLRSALTIESVVSCSRADFGRAAT